MLKIAFSIFYNTNILFVIKSLFEDFILQLKLCLLLNRENSLIKKSLLK